MSFVDESGNVLMIVMWVGEEEEGSQAGGVLTYQSAGKLGASDQGVLGNALDSLFEKPPMGGWSMTWLVSRVMLTTQCCVDPEAAIQCL